MILSHGHPVVGNAVGADRGTLHEVLHLRKGPHIAGGIFAGETQHVDGGIEPLVSHGALECRVVPAITVNHLGPFGYSPALPAIETSDLMALLEQEPHDAGADIARTPDDA